MFRYKKFEDWYNELESFGLRSERLYSCKEELRAAFESGRAVSFLPLLVLVVSSGVSTGVVIWFNI